MTSATTPTTTLRIALAITVLLTVALAGCGGRGDNSTSAARPATGAKNSATAVATIPGIAPLLTPTQPAQSATETVADSATTALESIDPAALQAEIDGLVSGVGGVTAVEVENPDGTSLASWNAGEQMEAASLYKLAIMVETYRQRDAGVITFDDQVVLQDYHFSEGGDVFSEDEVGMATDVATLLEAMITVSSNVAATALLEFVGTDNVNATMASLGLSSTQIRWYPGPTGDSGARLRGRRLLLVRPDIRADEAMNVTTAADIASLYRMLLAGEVVDASASQEMLDLLARQQINDRLPAYLPGGTIVAHKTGNLDGLMHDAGVIYAPAGPVIVVVMTEGVDEIDSTDLIAQIGLLAYESHQ